MNYGKENVGANIKRYRLKKGMTQEQLAKELDVNRQTVGRWENGTLEPRTKKLLAIAEVLGVTEYELLADEELMSKTVSLARATGIDAVERCKMAISRLNHAGIAKVTEYAELLATQDQYSNTETQNNGK